MDVASPTGYNIFWLHSMFVTIESHSYLLHVRLFFCITNDFFFFPCLLIKAYLSTFFGTESTCAIEYVDKLGVRLRLCISSVLFLEFVYSLAVASVVLSGYAFVIPQNEYCPVMGRDRD